MDVKGNRFFINKMLFGWKRTSKMNQRDLISADHNIA